MFASPLIDELIRAPRLGGRAYVGAGSRKASLAACKHVKEVAAALDHAGYHCRTGQAEGSDAAFRAGHQAARLSVRQNVTGMARQYVWRFHRNPGSLSPGQFDRLASYADRLFGPHFDSWARFVVCWTPDGSECPAQFTPKTGSIAFLITMAWTADIPVFNLRRWDAPKRLLDHITAIETSRDLRQVINSIDRTAA